MPINRTLDLADVSDEDFALIDEAVMRCAYATQNKFGRLFDERVYENDLAARLRAEGFDVRTQVPVTVTHGSFEKTYYLDLVVNQMLYELKVVAARLPEHKAQALHYAMLQNIQRVKLINFGEPKVRGQLCRNSMTDASRHQPKLRRSGWRIITPQCDRLIKHFKTLITDWGTHLSARLYNEALVHHFGGEAGCLQRFEVRSDGMMLGTHLVHLHAPDFAFFVTSITENPPAFRHHLDTLLNHSQLSGIQWINLNHSRVEITTLCEEDGKGMRAEE